MTLYTLAYPVLSDGDNAFIQAYRTEYDRTYVDMVAHHFTLAFGSDDISLDTYKTHVQSIAALSEPITFVCQYAMLGTAPEADLAHVFLVPDAGYGAISRLHDALYAGPLKNHLRLDIPFTPHITIGTMADAKLAKKLCDELNETSVSVEGRVEQISVCELKDGSVTNLEHFDL